MGFSHPENDLNLLGYVSISIEPPILSYLSNYDPLCINNPFKPFQTWKLWNEGNPIGLLDEKIDEPFSRQEVIRCIQVGMLCSQLRPEDRPMMHSVVLMLGNENVEVPEPKEPGFKAECIFMGTDSSSSARDSCITHNDISITTLEGRQK